MSLPNVKAEQVKPTTRGVSSTIVLKNDFVLGFLPKNLKNKSLQVKNMIKKCLFPVAGYGTRFLPATKAMPKEMLPVVNKPLVQYAVEEAAEAGLEDIAFVTGRGKRAIEDHFDVSYELETQINGTSKEKYLKGIRRIMEQCNFTYTRQREMKGLGHAILTAAGVIGDNPFAVTLADDLCMKVDGYPGVLSQMVEIFSQFRCTILAIEEVPDSEIHKYGIVSGELMKEGLWRVTDMVEKPTPEEAPGNLAIIGRYVFTPDIFDFIKNTPAGRGGEVQITDAIRAQAEKGLVLAYEFKGKRFDCGSVEGFVKATNYCFENHYYSEE